MRSFFFPKTVALLLCTVSLAACSDIPYLSRIPYFDSGVRTAKSTAPPPPVHSAAAESWSEPDKKKAEKKGKAVLTAKADEAPSQSRAVEVRTRQTVQSALAPAAGLSMEDRLIALEQSVASLRQDYARVKSALKGIDDTSERLETARPKKSGALKEASQKVKGSASVPVVQDRQKADQDKAAKGRVSVRVGEHPGYTRFVLDLPGIPDVAVRLDDGGNVLMVKLPEGAVDGLPSSGSRGGPMIASWAAQGSDMLAVQLKRSATILRKERLGPVDGYPSRLVVDLAPAGRQVKSQKKEKTSSSSSSSTPSDYAPLPFSSSAL